MSYKFTNILKQLLNALIEELPLALLLTFFFIAPACFNPWGDGPHIAFGPMIFLLANAAVWVISFTLIAHYKRWLWWTICILLHLYFFVELFSLFQQDCRICTSVITICLQTNTSEAMEFFKSPSSIAAFEKAILSISIIALLFCTLQYIWHRFIIIKSFHKKFISTPLAILLLVGFITSMIFCIFLWNTKLDSYWKVLSNNHLISSPLLLSHSIHDIQELNDQLDLEKLDSVMENMVVENESTDSLKIVFIIGESHIKHRSSSYGYFLETEPNIHNAIADSSLHVLHNVIAYSNTTIDIFRRLLSLTDANSSDTFDSTPLWPSVFKKSGYDVAFYDNQSLLCGVNFDFGCNYFLSSQSICNKVFSHTNVKRYEYDGELIDNYPILNNSKSLTIYHLIGEHVAAESRYPKDESYFSIEDYNILPNISNDIRQQMAYNDNAILYTDKQLGRIINELKDFNAIMIYVSDHGESIYDFNDTYGRKLLAQEPERVKTEIEVPAYIWLSKKYQEKHPEKVLALRRNTNKAIFNTDLSHTLLDLAGIKSTGYKARLSLLSDSIARTTRWVYPGNILNYDAMKPTIDSLHTRYQHLTKL